MNTSRACFCLLAATLSAPALSGTALAQDEATTSQPTSERSSQPGDNWPQFRGYRARGLAKGSVPTSWDIKQNTNVAWKTPIPGLAHSSPVVWGKKLFVTTAVRKKGKAELKSLFGSRNYGRGDSAPDPGEVSYRLYCLDTATGKVVWFDKDLTGYRGKKDLPTSITDLLTTPAREETHVSS